MCFSAPASFAASAALLTISVTLLSKIKTPRLFALALVPLFFGLQQAAEGWLWYSDKQSYPAQLIFTFFAFFFWPIWTPFSFWIAEPLKEKKAILMNFVSIGTLVGLIYFPVISDITVGGCSRSIFYDLPLFGSVASSHMIGIAYAVATLSPFFLSSLKGMWGVGLLGTIACAMTFILDELCFASLWCFFMAIISLALLYVLPKNEAKRS
jgi:hypothetical protein